MSLAILVRVERDPTDGDWSILADGGNGEEHWRARFRSRDEIEALVAALLRASDQLSMRVQLDKSMRAS